VTKSTFYPLAEADEQQRSFTYLDGLRAKVNALREPHKGVILQVKGGEELSALMASILDKAFKGEL